MRKQIAITVALIVAVGCLAMAQQPRITRAADTTKAENGRWQIVNGTPEMSRNIMLLDTQTGDSWITCADSKAGTNWCSMSRTYEQVGGVQSSESPVPPPMPKCLQYDKYGYCTQFEPPKP